MGALQPAESIPSLRERLPASAGSVAVARHAARRFAHGLDVDVDGLVLAVSEAVTNAVLHAYGEGGRGVVELSGAASPSEVTVAVRDRGTGLAVAPGHVGGAGFGLDIIRHLAQQVDLADTPEGVVLTMRFRRRPRAG